MRQNHPIQLFLASGCLTQKAMLAYLQGTLAVEDHKLVKDHLDDCPFCREAADGLYGIKSRKTIEREISSLNRLIIYKSVKQPSASPLWPVTKKIPVMKTWVYAAAASVVLLLGFYFMMQKMHRPEDSPQLAVITDTSREGTFPSGPEAESVPFDTGKPLSEIPEPVAESGKEVPPTVSAVPATVPAEQAESGRILDEVATAAEFDEPDSSTAPAESAEAMVTTLAEVTALEVPAAEKSQDRSVQEIGGIVAGAASKSDLRARSAYKARRSEEPAMTSQESMPEFPGGNDSLTAFIRRNLQYPPEALAMKVEGTVVVMFMIDQQGVASQAHIIQGIGSGCDEAVLHLIEIMPPWIPALHNGKPIRVHYNLPVQFKLPHEK